MADSQDIKLAKRVARIVVEGGEQGIAELRPALEKLLEGRSNSSRNAFLKEFHRAVVREVRKDTLVVESAKPLDPEVLDNLVANFSKNHGRPLQVVQNSNPELIAGIRARLGDTVYDATIAHTLQVLATRIR